MRTFAEIFTQGEAGTSRPGGPVIPPSQGRSFSSSFMNEYWVFYRTPVIEGRLFGWIAGNAEDAAVVVTVMEQYAGPPITLPKLLRE